MSASGPSGPLVVIVRIEKFKLSLLSCTLSEENERRRSANEACIGGSKYPISLQVNRQVSLINWHISP